MSQCLEVMSQFQINWICLVSLYSDRTKKNLLDGASFSSHVNCDRAEIEFCQQFCECSKNGFIVSKHFTLQFVSVSVLITLSCSDQTARKNKNSEFHRQPTQPKKKTKHNSKKTVNKTISIVILHFARKHYSVAQLLLSTPECDCK